MKVVDMQANYSLQQDMLLPRHLLSHLGIYFLIIIPKLFKETITNIEICTVSQTFVVWQIHTVVLHSDHRCRNYHNRNIDDVYFHTRHNRFQIHSNAFMV